MIIGIDFDGTCVSHEFPLVGNDIGSVSVLKGYCRKRKSPYFIDNEI